VLSKTSKAQATPLPAFSLSRDMGNRKQQNLLKCVTSGTVAKFNQSNSNSYFSNKTH